MSNAALAGEPVEQRGPASDQLASREQLVSHPVRAGAPLVVVLNTGSGKHETEQVRNTISAELARAGRQFELHEVTDPSDLADAARRCVEVARAQRGIVVAAGGDGTINTVAAATLGSGCPFGVVPLGTFNYFSRTHGIPSDIPSACRILLSRRAYEVQVGLVNERVFLVNASIGLYPELLEEREQAKRRLGRSRLVAVLAALGSLLRPHRSLRLDVVAKGASSRITTPTLFIGNNRLQLERVGIAESAVIERNRLVAVVLERAGVLALLGLLLRALLGRLGDAERVVTFDFERLTVRGRLGARRFKVATDGEVRWLSSPLTFRVAPHALLLLRPAEAGEDPG